MAKKKSKNTGLLIPLIIGAVGGGIAVVCSKKNKPEFKEHIKKNMIHKKMEMAIKGCHKIDTIPQMVVDMIPRFVKVMLPKIAKEKRADFASEIVSTLFEHSNSDMNDDEKKVYIDKIKSHFKPPKKEPKPKMEKKEVKKTKKVKDKEQFEK